MTSTGIPYSCLIAESSRAASRAADLLTDDPPHVLLDRATWPVALSGFSGGSVAVAIDDGSHLAELVALGDHLSRFRAVDLFFTGDIGTDIGADLVDLYRAQGMESPSGSQTTHFRVAPYARLNPVSNMDRRHPAGVGASAPGTLLSGWLNGLRVGFVGTVGRRLLGDVVRSLDVETSWLGELETRTDSWLDVLVVDMAGTEADRALHATLAKEAREMGVGVVTISSGTSDDQFTEVTDLMLDSSQLSATAVAAGLVCPVGYRRVVGGRVGVVGSLVSGGDGLSDVLGLVEGLADDPGVDVFGLVRGVSLPDGVKVFDGGFDGGLVDRLREYGGVVDHRGLHASLAERAEVLMGLAAAGVPVVAADVDDELVGLIGAEMADVLVSAEIADLGDPEARDRLSVLLRRFGLSAGSQVSKWREIAGSLDLTVAPLPTVSVVLATNRPDYLEHCIGQVKAQTYPEVELVLVLHGDSFTITDQELEDLYGGPLVVVRTPSKYVYGAVLNQGVAASTGTLIAKMDDDDWYTPEHLWDLVRAMDYSGAGLVGKAAEFVYLEELDITIRRMVEGAETYGNRNLAGGTFLIKRTTLDTIGGWRRLPRQVDQALLEDLETLAIPWYRTLGYGYMLHRRAEGHTWEADVDYFLEHSEMQWRGFDPHASLIDN